MPAPPPLIAVVDDSAFVSKALQRLLRAAGFRVETHSSGAEFLSSIGSRVPDCVVLDLHMPGMDGFEVQAQLQRAGTAIPVVIITGHDEPGSRARAFREGAKGYLCKPVDENALLRLITAAISGEPFPPDGNGYA
jgi:FixJ family two-component response regulator